MPKVRTSPYDKIVAYNVRRRRRELDMSQKTLADRIGLSHRQIHNYEKNTARIGAGTLYELAIVLNVDVSYFFDSTKLAEETLE